MRDEHRRRAARVDLSRGLSVVCAAVAAASAGRGQDTPSAEELSRLQALDTAIDGSIVYVKKTERKVYKIEIGVPDAVAGDGRWEETEICSGDYARFGPDGSKIAVGYNGSIYVYEIGPDTRTQVPGSYVVSGTIPPLDFHTNGHEIIFVQSGILAVDILTDQLRQVAKYHTYDGEPGISLSGNRIAARDRHNLYAVVADADDPALEGDRMYVEGCSAGVSPDGARLMNNVFSHLTMTIRDWDGSAPVDISADICEPELAWDNHHWSNHPSYIAVQGDHAAECYILDVSDTQNVTATRVTWTGGVACPDIWVDRMVRVTGRLTISGTSPAEVVSGAVVTLTDGSSVSVTTHTDHNGDYMILGTDAEIPDGTYDITAQGLSPDPLGTVTVTSGAGTADLDVTELDADAGGPDGLPDWWELRYFGDLTTTDGTGDQDEDGKSDYEEYLAGTSPTTKAKSPSSDGGGGCVPQSPGKASALLVCLVAAAALARRRQVAGTCRG